MFGYAYERNKSKPIEWAMLVVVLGIGFLIIGIFSIENILYNPWKSAQAEGKIINTYNVITYEKSSRHKAGGKRIWYNHVIEFHDLQGVTTTFELVSGRPDEFYTGQQLPVFFQVENPKVAYIESRYSLFFQTASLLIGGFVILFVGSYWAIRIRSKK